MSSLLKQLESLVGVIEGGFNLSDLVIQSGEVTLGVGELASSNIQSNSQKVSALLVGFDSLVFSESLEGEGVFDLLDESAEQVEDSEGKL